MSKDYDVFYYTDTKTDMFSEYYRYEIRKYHAGKEDSNGPYQKWWIVRPDLVRFDEKLSKEDYDYYYRENEKRESVMPTKPTTEPQGAHLSALVRLEANRFLTRTPAMQPTPASPGGRPVEETDGRSRVPSTPRVPPTPRAPPVEPPNENTKTWRTVRTWEEGEDKFITQICSDGRQTRTLKNGTVQDAFLDTRALLRQLAETVTG
jgi:hypothetical protein